MLELIETVLEDINEINFDLGAEIDYYTEIHSINVLKTKILGKDSFIVRVKDPEGNCLLVFSGQSKEEIMDNLGKIQFHLANQDQEAGLVLPPEDELDHSSEDSYDEYDEYLSYINSLEVRQPEFA